MTVTFTNHGPYRVRVVAEDGVRVGEILLHNDCWYFSQTARRLYEAEMLQIADKLAELNGEKVGE